MNPDRPVYATDQQLVTARIEAAQRAKRGNAEVPPPCLDHEKPVRQTLTANPYDFSPVQALSRPETNELIFLKNRVRGFDTGYSYDPFWDLVAKSDTVREDYL